MTQSKTNSWDSINFTENNTFFNRANAVQNQLNCKLEIASYKNLTATDLQLKYGLLVEITRIFGTNRQVVTLQVKDPYNCTGLSLYYSENRSPPEETLLQYADKITAVKSPMQMIVKYNQPGNTWEDMMTALMTKIGADDNICETPFQIKHSQLKSLEPKGWLSGHIINWWLAYWCSLLPDTTYFLEQGAKSRKSGAIPDVKQKFICASSHFWDLIANNSTTGIEKLDFWDSLGILVPIHENNNHWLLLHIRFDQVHDESEDKSKSQVTLLWYDSLVDEDNTHNFSKHLGKIDMISRWLDNQSNGHSSKSDSDFWVHDFSKFKSPNSFVIGTAVINTHAL